MAQGSKRTASAARGPAVLSGVKVLDLSWGIAGPMAGMLLASQGADVTKIEPPRGDPFRARPGYRVWNRGKRSAIIDLKAAAGRDQLLHLIGDADVLLESFSPGVTDRLGIGYQTVAAVNPALVYCSITGYGRGTQEASRPGYDALVQARTGMQWDQRGRHGNIYDMCRKEAPLGEVEIPDGALEHEYLEQPIFVASRWPSLGACYLASIAISSALYVREKTGRGQLVETSLLQGAIGASTMVWQRPQHPEVDGYVSWYYDGRAPMGFFECADGRWVCYCFPTPQFLTSASAGDQLQATAETVDPRRDPTRFAADHFELAVVLALYPKLRDAVRKFPSRDWVDLATELGVPLSPVLSIAEALSDPRFLADGCVVEVDDPEEGRIRCAGTLYHLSRSKPEPLAAAPRAGEHTAEVLREAAGPATSRPPAAPAPAPATKPAPLAGISVIDLGIATAGPFGTQVLSDLGADVIRVNGLHDDFLIGHQYICAARGKRSLAINLKDPRSKEVVARLVRNADVVHYNIRKGAAGRLAIGYEDLKAINPQIICCHTGGYEAGEREDLPSNDVLATAVTGVAWADGGCDNGGAPMWAETGLGDVGNGYLSALAVIQALYDRERTGLGQEVDTSLVYACLLNSSYTYLRPDGADAEMLKPDKEMLGLSALYRVYPTSDGWICIAAIEEAHWPALCDAVDRPDLEHNPLFASATARETHDRRLVEELTATFLTQPATTWRASLDAAGVPAEVSDPDWPRKMFDDPELIERGWVTHTEHPTLGRFDQHGVLFDFSETPGRVAGPPPMLGQHSFEILAELGFTDDEVASLEQANVIVQWKP